MSNISLNKTSLINETKKMKTFQRYVPTLELKRKQIIIRRLEAKHALEDTESRIKTIMKYVKSNLPMLGDERVNLSSLAYISNVETSTENVVGIWLPMLITVDVGVKKYSFLAKPAWVDEVVNRLGEILELKIKYKIQKERLDLLDDALKKTTQRLNLFDKVLIPRTKENIRKIKIFLSDAEKASVVCAKITKKKTESLEGKKSYKEIYEELCRVEENVA